MEIIGTNSILRLETALQPLAGWPNWMPRLSFTPAGQTSPGDTLVVVFLRGAADVLNMVAPFGEAAYYRLRPTLGIAPPDQNSHTASERALNLDGFFGLHPAMAPLLPLWQEGALAIVHACGAPDESRSHFKAMALMERGVEDERGPASGWIGRHLASLDTGNTSPLRAIGLGGLPQRSLIGAVPVSVMRSISDYHLGGQNEPAAHLRAALQALYAGQGALEKLGQETLAILDTLEAVNPLDYQSGSEAAYPESEFGLGLRQVAALVRAQVGLEVAAIDLGGWDTHFAQGSTSGWMPNLMAELAQGLAAFYTDLHAYTSQLTVVVMSEFGRRVQENGSLGTDHGHGSAMFLLGGHMRGGIVHGNWPGLEDGQLVGPGDLAVTTDYRDVLAEVCLKRLNNPALEVIFPGYAPKLPGIVM